MIMTTTTIVARTGTPLIIIMVIVEVEFTMLFLGIDDGVG